MSQAGAARLDRTQLEGRACLLCAAPQDRFSLYPVGRIDDGPVFVCECVGAPTIRHLQAGGELRFAVGEINALIDEGD